MKSFPYPVIVEPDAPGHAVKTPGRLSGEAARAGAVTVEVEVEVGRRRTASVPAPRAPRSP